MLMNFASKPRYLLFLAAAKIRSKSNTNLIFETLFFKIFLPNSQQADTVNFLMKQKPLFL